MAFLIDTSILVRLANATDPQHAIAARAVLELHRRGEILHITPQALVEFRNVATRPKHANGAGLPIAEAETHAATFEATFPLLAETPQIYPAWKAWSALSTSSASRCMMRGLLPSAMRMPSPVC